MPQHRLYFHEYTAPDWLAYKQVRQVVDWLNDPETRKTRNGIRIAARAHFDLLRVYPFPTDSGKVARLFMNLLLMRTGLPPAIVHSTERQKYYEALKGSATTVLQMVQEAVENALSSVEKLLDEHETKKRAFPVELVTPVGDRARKPGAFQSDALRKARAGGGGGAPRAKGHEGNKAPQARESRRSTRRPRTRSSARCIKARTANSTTRRPSSCWC